jgi:hypothetical protein
MTVTVSLTPCYTLDPVRFMYDSHCYSMLPLNLNSINQLIFVMVKCGVLFKVRTEFLNVIRRASVSKGKVSFILFARYSYQFPLPVVAEILSTECRI